LQFLQFSSIFFSYIILKHVNTFNWYQSLVFLEGIEAESSFSHISSPIFDGENYQLWAVKMKTYLDALDLWEAVEDDYEVHPLPTNPTVAQIKNHKERKTRKSKAKACLFAAVSTTIFTRIMSLKSAKDV